MKKTLLLTMLLALLGVFSAMAADDIVAFPGATGFGRYVTGGRGGQVYYVTSTSDCPDNALVKGTLRWALNTGDDSPRTVLFATSGTIYLTSKLTMKHPNVSILGQSAPGGGVCLAGYPLYINKDNVIIRYVRFRAGDVPNQSFTGLDMENAKGVILDHCSMTWSMEECLTAYDTDSTTVQWCIIGEGLYNSKNAKGARAYAMQWGGEHSSMLHTLITNSHSRSPRFNGVRNVSTVKGDHDYQVNSEFANNVVFNGGKSYGGEFNTDVNNTSWYDANNPGYDRVYMINNYYRAGPCTVGENFTSFTQASSPYGQYYMKGNKQETGGTYSSKLDATTLAAVNADNFSGTGLPEANKLTGFPVILQSYDYDSADDAYGKVTTMAGASLPRYDEVDTRLLAEAAGKVEPQFVGETLKASGEYGIIDSPSDITLKEHDTFMADGVEQTNYPFLGMRDGDKYIVDSDYDGLPDIYETMGFLNPNDASDAAKITNNGYSNLENYLNGIADGTITKSIYETSTSPLKYETTPVTVKFKKSDSDIEGDLPDDLTMSEGDIYTIAVNTKLYKEGYTLTGWNNGTTTYAIGSSFTITGNTTLTTVFTKNKENISERNANYTLKWDTRDIAGKMSDWKSSGMLVAQNKLSIATIDTKLSYNITPNEIIIPAGSEATAHVYYKGGMILTAQVEEDGSFAFSSDLIDSVIVKIPYKKNTSISYHSPECAEGKTYEILKTPGDAFTAPSWVKVSGFSDANRKVYDPDKDDKATTTTLESVVLKAASNNTMDVYVKNTERVRIFASGSSSSANFLKVTAVPNDGSDIITVQNETGVIKNIPLCLDLDLDKTKSYRLFLEPGSEKTEIAIAALKLMTTTALPATGDATVAWPLSSGDIKTVNITPEGCATSTLAISDALASVSDSKTGTTKIYPKTTKASAKNDSQVLTFTVTPEEGVELNITGISFGTARLGTNGGNFDATIQLGDGAETALETAGEPDRDALKTFSYTGSYSVTSTSPLVLRIYPYNVATNKGLAVGNVTFTGSYNNDPTAVSMVNAQNDNTSQATYKVLSNGRLLIIRSNGENGSHTYNAAGQLVK